MKDNANITGLEDVNNLKVNMNEVMNIVTKLAVKYGGIDHSSIPYEKAQQLMGAVLYTIREARTENRGLQNTQLSLCKEYEMGKEIINQKVIAMKEKFNRLMNNWNDYGNICLYDTVCKGIPEFLKWYDPIYNPQDTILTLDYPILEDLSNLSGIDKVQRYIDDIEIEQKVLSAVGDSYISKEFDDLMNVYNISVNEAVENLCHLVLLGVCRRNNRGSVKDVINYIVNSYYGGDEKIRNYALLDAMRIEVEIRERYN